MRSALARTRPELWREKGYRNGSILRIKMVNFLTYDECEVFPGPKLNVVIGKCALRHAVLPCAGRRVRRLMRARRLPQALTARARAPSPRPSAWRFAVIPS